MGKESGTAVRRTLSRLIALFVVVMAATMGLASEDSDEDGNIEWDDPPTGPFVNVSKAPVIVIGETLRTTGYWDESDDTIRTITDFHVQETQRGEIEPDTAIEVVSIGGEINGEEYSISLRVSNQPVFVPGENSRLFLEKGDGFYTLVAGTDGKQDADRGIKSENESCPYTHIIDHSSWPPSEQPVPFRVNEFTVPAGATSAVTNGHLSWNSVSDSAMEYSYAGHSSTSEVDLDNNNLVFFGTDEDHPGEFGNALAINYWWSTGTFGDILETDIIFNIQDADWVEGEDEEAFDIETTSVHEAGHRLGLGHVDNREEQVMGSPHPGAGFINRDLGCGDELGTLSHYESSIPGAPSDLTANPSGPSQVFLSWNEPTNDGGYLGIESYRIQRDTGSGWTTRGTVDGDTTSFLDDVDMTSAADHNYRVRASNSWGSGPYSNVACTKVGLSAILLECGIG